MNTIKSNAHMRCENCDHDQFSLFQVVINCLELPATLMCLNARIVGYT